MPPPARSPVAAAGVGDAAHELREQMVGVAAAEDVVPLAVLRGDPPTTDHGDDAHRHDDDGGGRGGWAWRLTAPARARPSPTDWSRPLLHLTRGGTR